MESLAQLEVLCERLYNSQNSVERSHAENTLKCFSMNTDYISQCQYILDNASTPYALMLASSSLLKQVTEHSLSLQLRLDIRNYLVNYLANRGPELQPFVTGSLIQLLCRVTKFGWFDDDRFRDVVKESMNFLIQATPDHCAIGLKILNQLVCEMNQASPGLPSTRHRKVECSFRDQSLFQVFQMSLTSLQQLKSEVGSRLRELALSLALKCFVGTSIDESSDEFGTVQMPTSWKTVIEDPSTLQIFFDYHAITKPPLSKEALECLVRLALVRRSLFTNDAARSKFLAHLMTGSKEILQAGQGLADHDNYHEYCRLLGRVRVNYQVLFNSHIVFVLNLDSSTFMHIVGSLQSGLKGLDSTISTQCASAIDNLAAFYFNNITMGEAPTLQAAINLSRHTAECPTLFPEIFADLKAHLLGSQPADQHQRLSLCFDKLMADVTRSLDSKNRDKFTQNLMIFRHDFRVK